MKHELRHYSINPKIFKVGTLSKIKIKPLGEHVAFKEKEYSIQIIPMFMSREPKYDYDVQIASVIDGCINFGYNFSSEQEYIVRLFRECDIKISNGKKNYPQNNAYLNLKVYALEKDLYLKRPFKGDFHSHSCESDGTETPEITASNFRKNGFDFYALTDHRKYAPSIQCKNYYADKPIDFTIVQGEEVHGHNNHVHIINFGSKSSVNEFFMENPEQYDNEVKEILAKLTIPDNVDGYTYASCLWVFKKINELGGLSVLAHPHWSCDAYNVSEPMLDLLFESQKFDAFEVLGGQEVLENNLQLAYYYEELARGKKIPIVGVSDAHCTEQGSDWFNWNYTIVFAEDMQIRNLQNAVKDLYSVAIEAYPKQPARVHGSYRLVKYTQFLLMEYFPIHDELCFEEGRLMKEMFLGEEDAIKILALMQGRVKKLQNLYFEG